MIRCATSSRSGPSPSRRPRGGGPPGWSATALHLDFQAPATCVWDAVAFVKEKVIVPPDSLAPELRGLLLRVHVFTPEMEHYLYVELFPEVTAPSQQSPDEGR
jgi:hypothetical protein